MKTLTKHKRVKFRDKSQNFELNRWSFEMDSQILGERKSKLGAKSQNFGLESEKLWDRKSKLQEKVMSLDK